MNGEELAEVRSMIRCLINFGGAMPWKSYAEAADLMRALLAHVDRLTARADAAEADFENVRAEWEHALSRAEAAEAKVARVEELAEVLALSDPIGQADAYHIRAALAGPEPTP